MNIIRSGRFPIDIGIGIGIGDFDSDADPKNIHTQRFRYYPKIVGADSDPAPIPKKVKFAHPYYSSITRSPSSLNTDTHHVES
jgi:hypothetical protein